MTIGVPEHHTAQTVEQTTASRRLIAATPRGLARRRLSGVALYGIALALIASVGMLYLLQTSYVASLGYEMTQLQQQREELTVRNQQLRSALAQRQSLGNVEDAAVTDLGLVPAKQTMFLTVERPTLEDDVSGSPEHPESRSFFDLFLDRLLGRGVVDSDPGAGREQ